MKNNLYKMLAVLIVFTLAACQPETPTKTVATTEFFKNQPGKWITVLAPKDWVAVQKSGSAPAVIVTNDQKGYFSTNTKAIGILITPLADQGSAEDALQAAIKRLGNALTTPVGEVALEQAAGQSYASIEYDGLSAEQEGMPAHYFLAVISTSQRSVLVFSAVDPDQAGLTRPAYQSVLKGITLH